MKVLAGWVSSTASLTGLLTAIICVPLGYFMFLHRYTKSRGFLLTALFVYNALYKN